MNAIIDQVQQTKAKMDAMNTMLEALIDLHGLDLVLAQIREICYDKANHIAHEWQDVALARQWLANGLRVNSAAQSVRS